MTPFMLSHSFYVLFP
jgi:hypothetical protein